MAIKVKVLRESRKREMKKVEEASTMDDINSLIADQEAQIAYLKSRKGKGVDSKAAQKARHRKELEAMKAGMGKSSKEKLSWKDWPWHECKIPTNEQVWEMANGNPGMYDALLDKVKQTKQECSSTSGRGSAADLSGRLRVADEQEAAAAAGDSREYAYDVFEEALRKHINDTRLDEAFGLGEMAVAVMVSFGGTRVEIDKNDMKAAEAIMQRIEKREEFSGVPSIDIRQEFDRMADEIRNNARAKVDDDRDGISDMEANFGVYDAADELATQIFLRADKQEAAKPKQEIPATQGIGAQSGEQKDLFQRLKDMVGMGGTKAPPAMKGKKTPSNQKQVRDAVKKANKKARKKMMDL